MKLSHTFHSSERSEGRTGREGHALLLAVTLLATLMVLSYAFFRPTASAQKEVNGKLDDRRAFALAEAGLSESLEALREGQSGAIGTPNTPAAMGGGVLWVTTTDLGGSRHQIVSTAAVGSGRRAISAVVEVKSSNNPLFVATLNSKEKLTLNADVMIDSFDSERGDYLSQALNTLGIHTFANDNGDVRSNEDIELNARAAVFGDAYPGPGYSVTMATDAFVTGTTTSASEPFGFPVIDFPTYPIQPSISLGRNATRTIAPGQYEISQISIGRDATLTVEGPAEIVVDDFIGGKLGNLVIDATNGPVTFKIRNTYSHLSEFEVSPAPGSPNAVAFMIDGTTDIVFPSATPIRGAYYVPNANIVFSNDNECWGSFAAKRIDMSNTMRFHYDESLAKHWDADGGSVEGTLTLLSWNETRVRPQALLDDRRDPIQVLNLQQVALASPFDSWIEKLKAQSTR